MTKIRDLSNEEGTVQPPPFPWVDGVTDKYRCFSLLVKVLQTNDGFVFSNHRPATDEDEKTATTFPNGGLEQIAFALLMEAVRRETFILSMVKMTGDKEYLNKYLEADEEKKMEIETELAENVREVLQKNINQMSFPTSKEILFMLSQSHKEQSNTP